MQHEIIREGSFDSETVTRKEAIIAIMRAIGANDNLDHCNFAQTSYNAPVYDDLYTSLEDTGEGNGYIYAAAFNDIAAGSAFLNTGTFFEFFPHRPATARQITAFLLRCLGEAPPSMDEVLAKGEEIGLIQPKDSFYDKGDEPVSVDDFCLMLYRFMLQRRYLYFDQFYVHILEDKIRGIDPLKASKDEQRSMTYLEQVEAAPLAKTKVRPEVAE